MLDCIEKLVTADVNRLVIVSEDDKVEGIVTVSDMIDFLVLRNNITNTESSPSKRNIRARPRTLSVNESKSITGTETWSSETECRVTREETVPVSECANVMINLNKSLSESDSKPRSQVRVISVRESPHSVTGPVADNSLGESEESSLSTADTPPPTWFSVNLDSD